MIIHQSNGIKNIKNLKSVFHLQMNLKKMLHAISFLWFGSLLGAFCAFITQVILARTLGPTEYGAFASALSAASILVPVAGFGVAQLWLKIFGVEGHAGVRWISPSFDFIKFSVIFSIAAIITWAIIGPNTKATQYALVILSTYIIQQLYLELTSSKLQLEERYVLLSAIQIIPHGLRLILISAVILFTPYAMDSLTTSIIYALVSLPIIIWGVREMSKLKHGKLALKGHSTKQSTFQTKKPSVKEVAIDAFPFGMAATFHLIMFQINILIVGLINGPTQSASYAVAFSVMTAVYLVPNVIYQKFLLPKLHRWASHDRKKFLKVYNIGTKAMLTLGILAFASIISLAPWAIPILFGEEYKSSIVVLQVLAICAPIRFVASNAGSALLTQEHMKIKVYLMGISALTMITFSLLLIPKYEVIGAAVSTVLSDLLLLVLYYYFAQKKVVGKSIPHEPQ